ncbi:MAG: SDR family NAD(P)-dependent oxidoreductase [Pseudomonadota bacterium]
MPNEHLHGRVVVITGAGGGFGRLIAQRCGTLGARVVCADVDGNAAEAAAVEIIEAGGQALGVTADVTDAAAMQALAASATETFERIDVWINNAGIMPLAFYADHAAALNAWHRCIDINIKGVLNGIVAAFDPMMQAGRGHVVNVSSIYGNFPVVGAGVYGATKSAVNFLSESLRVESAGKIKVTIIKPTGVPATNLGSAVVNPAAVTGILGQNTASYGATLAAMASGELDGDAMSADSIGYKVLAPEHIADQVVYAINQPWGVSIGDVTIRAAGDEYIL